MDDSIGRSGPEPAGDDQAGTPDSSDQELSPKGPIEFKALREQLRRRTDLGGLEWCRTYAAAADAWLGQLLREATGGDVSGLAVLAVGGYGRGALCPWSDLDVVLLHDKHRDVDRVAQALWYPIWDQGVSLDHSVRTRRQALAVAETDLRALLGLLDARLVSGDPEVPAGIAAAAANLLVSKAGRMLPELSASVQERHRQEGEVAFLLEPDLKEGRGGLRDLHLLAALDTLGPPARDALTLDELGRAEEVLTAARVELHRRSTRPMDRLLLQEQDNVAAGAGFADADQLMAAVAQAGRVIAWVSDDAWQRVRSRLAGPKGRVVSADRRVGPGVLVREGEVTLSVDADVSGDPSLTLRLAAAAAELGLPIARSALARLASGEIVVPEPWPSEMREALVSLLGSGHQAVAALETIDQVHLLTKLLPEWSAVRNKPQRNAYHRFTVDRHLLEAAAQAAALVRQVSRPDLLLVGALLHDIGKGFPGDHTTVGVELVRSMGTRMGFSPDDVETLTSMVSHHLLLADTATRRDLDDPTTIEIVAGKVADRETLALLAALTQADSLATGPAAWSPWKAGLVADLVSKVGRRLEGFRSERSAELSSEQQELLAAGKRALRVDGDQVTVVAADRPGMLAIVAGVLALHGLDVRSASASATEEGMAIEVFEVNPSLDRPTNWERLEEELWEAMAGNLPLETLLVQRARTYGARRPSAAVVAEPKVIFDKEASEGATVVEVRAPDGVGVLHRIARALALCDLDVVTARLSSIGHEVVDAFYVQDAAGRKPTSDETLRAVESSVLEALRR